MRTLFLYIRSCFCLHKWKLEEVQPYPITIPDQIVVSATCTKCGWHRNYYKFYKIL